ncbi:MAG TPA: hypothetical protein VHA06_14490 [Candidatus Angelobacter sp.]|jgi:hypothetical protein|nr:hypothetical protein [Candidatus Angelobacter sp.]
MAARRELRCPACQGSLAEVADPRNMPWVCPACGARITISSLALWLVLPIGFVASILVVQLLGLQANAALLWFPILFLCLFAALRVMIMLPPRLKVVPESAKGAGSVKKDLILFVIIWLSLVLYLVAYGFVTGLLASIMQASDDDKMIVPSMFSVPLGLMNRAFLITPDKGLADVLGILTANSYFYALVLTFILKTVHGFLNRSRTIQLGISDKTAGDDDVL